MPSINNDMRFNLFSQISSLRENQDEKYGHYRNTLMSLFDFGQNYFEIQPFSKNGKIVIKECKGVAPELHDVVLRIIGICTLILPVIAISLRAYYLYKNDFIEFGEVFNRLTLSLAPRKVQVFNKLKDPFSIPWELYKKIFSYLLPFESFSLAFVNKFFSNSLWQTIQNYHFIGKCHVLTKDTTRKTHVETIHTLAMFNKEKAIQIAKERWVDKDYRKDGFANSCGFYRIFKYFQPIEIENARIEGRFFYYPKSTAYEIWRAMIKDDIARMIELEWDKLTFNTTSSLLGSSGFFYLGKGQENRYSLKYIGAFLELREISYEDFEKSKITIFNKLKDKKGREENYFLYGLIMSLAPIDIQISMDFLQLMEGEIQFGAISRLIKYLNLDHLLLVLNILKKSDHHNPTKSVVLAQLAEALFAHGSKYAEKSVNLLFNCLSLDFKNYDSTPKLIESDLPILENLLLLEDTFIEQILKKEHASVVEDLFILFDNSMPSTLRYFTNINRYGLTINKIIEILMRFLPQKGHEVIQLVRDSYNKLKSDEPFYNIQLKLAIGKALASFDNETSRQFAFDVLDFYKESTHFDNLIYKDILSKVGQIFAQIDPLHALSFVELFPSRSLSEDYFLNSILAVALQKIRDNGIIWHNINIE